MSATTPDNKQHNNKDSSSREFVYRVSSNFEVEGVPPWQRKVVACSEGQVKIELALIFEMPHADLEAYFREGLLIIQLEREL